MKRQYLLTSLAVVTVALACASGCNLPGASSASAAVDNSSTDLGSSSSGGGGTSSSGGSGSSSSSSGATSYGINCTSSNGYDKIAGNTSDTSGETPTPYLIIPHTSGLTGSTINTVQVTLYLTSSNDQTSPSGTQSASVSMTAYSCVPPGGPLGSSVATANMSSNVLAYTPTLETFSFGGGLTIPTNCASGDYPLVFEVNYTPGLYLWAATGGPSSGSSCFAPLSTNGLSEGTRSWAFTINANQ